MRTPCDRHRFCLDDEDASDVGALERLARAEHLRVCPDCRNEMQRVSAQRATVRGVFGAGTAAPPLSEVLVARCVDAMKRAARDVRDAGHAAG